MKFIRDLFGKWTRSDTLFKYNDEYYAPIKTHPIQVPKHALRFYTYNDLFEVMLRKFNYQMVTRDWLGRWRYETEWIGLSRPLEPIKVLTEKVPYRVEGNGVPTVKTADLVKSRRFNEVLERMKNIKLRGE